MALFIFFQAYLVERMAQLLNKWYIKSITSHFQLVRHEKLKKAKIMLKHMLYALAPVEVAFMPF